MTRENCLTLPWPVRVRHSRAAGNHRNSRNSLARFPATGKQVFGREDDFAFLDGAWADSQVNVVTSWLGRVWANPRWSTIGWGTWLLTIIVLQNSFLAGPSTGRAPVGALRRRMNFSTRLSLGLVTWTHGSERPGRRRTIGEAYRPSSNLIGPGRPGATAKSAGPPGRTAAGAFPSGAATRALCLQFRALRDYHQAGGR